MRHNSGPAERYLQILGGEVMKKLVALLALLLSSPVAATPTISSVSGTLASGSTLTVNGASFGTKGVAAPFRYDNFEAGTIGALYTGPYVRDDNETTFSNRRLRTNSTRSVECSFLSGDYSTNFGVVGFNNLNTLYLDAWYYYDAASPPSRNHKVFRFHANTYSPNLYYNLYCDDASHLAQDGDGCTNTGAKTDEWPGVGGTPYFARKWSHLQGYFKFSSPSTNDGTVLLWIDNVLWVNGRNAWCNQGGGGVYWSDFWFGNYLGHDATDCPASGDAYTYWDDAYIDTTQAHVEIGDAPTYNSCSEREIQVASAWSASAINITLNQGSFADFAGKYVYVTDRSGAVNAAGFPLTGGGPPSTCSSGGGGGGPPPNVVLVQSPAAAVFGAAIIGNISFPLPPVVGNYIIVCTANGVGGGPRTVTSVTDNIGNTYTAAGSGFTWGTTRRNEIWYAKNIANSPCTITVTMSGSTDFSYTASEFSGLATSSVVDVSGGSSATNAFAQTVLTTVNANDLVVGVMAHGNAAVGLTPGSGYTQLSESESATFMPIHSEFQVFTTTGLHVVDVATSGPVTWGVYAVAFKAAP